MWNSIVSVPDHCPIYFTQSVEMSLCPVAVLISLPLHRYSVVMFTFSGSLEL